jgi:predicted  nucleic acid-binding Zn-ribbon protein
MLENKINDINTEIKAKENTIRDYGNDTTQAKELQREIDILNKKVEKLELESNLIKIEKNIEEIKQEIAQRQIDLSNIEVS